MSIRGFAINNLPTDGYLFRHLLPNDKKSRNLFSIVQVLFPFITLIWYTTYLEQQLNHDDSSLHTL